MTRLLAATAQRGAECAAREDCAVFGAMRELEPLARAGENHAVIADDAAAPQCLKADIALAAGAGMAVAAAHRAFAKRNVAPARRALPKQQRGARGRIDFHLVMHFQNFDVPI